MKRMSPALSDVSKPTRSPGRSSTGPDVVRMPTLNSLAMSSARVVLPRPGGPKNNAWSSGSRRCFAASMDLERLLDLRLADELVEPGRAQRRVGAALVGQRLGRRDLRPGGRHVPTLKGGLGETLSLRTVRCRAQALAWGMARQRTGRASASSVWRVWQVTHSSVACVAPSGTRT